MDKIFLQRILKLFLIIGDIVLICLGVLLAYYLRFYINIVPVKYGIPLLKNYIYPLPIVVIIFLLSFNYAGLYRFQLGVSRLDEFKNIFISVFVSITIAISLIFFIRHFSYSRIVLVFMFLIDVVTISIWRNFYRL